MNWTKEISARKWTVWATEVIRGSPTVSVPCTISSAIPSLASHKLAPFLTQTLFWYVAEGNYLVMLYCEWSSWNYIHFQQIVHNDMVCYCMTKPPSNSVLYEEKYFNVMHFLQSCPICNKIVFLLFSRTSQLIVDQLPSDLDWKCDQWFGSYLLTQDGHYVTELLFTKLLAKFALSFFFVLGVP